jgi:hypothetical protein
MNYFCDLKHVKNTVREQSGKGFVMLLLGVFSSIATLPLIAFFHKITCELRQN